MAEAKPVQMSKEQRHQYWMVYRMATGLAKAIEKLVGREQLDAAASEKKD